MISTQALPSFQIRPGIKLKVKADLIFQNYKMQKVESLQISEFILFVYGMM